MDSIRKLIREILSEIDLFTNEYPFIKERESEKAVLAKIPYIFNNRQEYFKLWVPKSILVDNKVPQWFVYKQMGKMKEDNPSLNFDHIKPTLGEFIS